MTQPHALRRSRLANDLLHVAARRSHLTGYRIVALSEAAHHLAGGDAQAAREALAAAAKYRRAARAVRAVVIEFREVVA